MIKKLKWQFVTINMVLVLLVVVPVFIFMQYSLKRELAMDSFIAIEEGFKQFGIKVFNDKPPERINENKEYFKPIDFNGASVNGKSETAYNRHFFNTFYIILDNKGNILKTYSRSDFELTEEDLDLIVQRIYQKENRRGEISDLSLRFILEQYTDENGEELIAIGVMDISNEYKILSEQRSLILTVCCVLLFVFFIISIYLSNIIIKPIEKSWKQQKQFISDVSHELKTPTAVILANTSILSMNENLKEDKKWVDYIDIEAKRMKNLVEDLLFLSKSDYTKNQQILSTCNISDIIMNTLLPFEALIFESEKKVTIETDLEPNIEVLGDENQLNQLIMILIDNAYKYCYENSSIKVSLKNIDIKNNVILSVNNVSDVISKEDLEHLFDRFYKVDKSRNRESNSYGLGLAIAQEIVNNHKGKISVKSDDINGTTFKITLPICDKH